MVDAFPIALISGFLLFLCIWALTSEYSSQKCGFITIVCAIFLGCFVIVCGIHASIGEDYYKEQVILDYCNGEIKIDTTAITPEGKLHEIKIIKEK